MPLVCQATGPAFVIDGGGTSYPVTDVSGTALEACTQWVTEDLADAASLGITPADIAATAGGVAGGVVGLYLLAFAIGSVSRLFFNAITGD